MLGSKLESQVGKSPGDPLDKIRFYNYIFN